MKKRLIVLINVTILLSLMLMAAGCGGGGGDTVTTTAPTTEPPGTVVPAGGTPAGTAAAAELPVPRKYPAGPDTPKFFQEALAKKEPILLMFYSPTGIDSAKERDELKSVYERFNKDVLFLTIDIEEPEKSSTLADQFGVGDVPHISILDKEGNVVREFKGTFTDGKVIEQVLYTLVNS